MELRAVKTHVETQALTLRENNSILTKLLWMVSGEIVAPLKSLGQTVTKICVSTQQIYIIVLELRNSVRGIDTRFTYFQAPVRVEDALGRVFPFPPECSVEALTAEIKARFQEGPGNEEVMTRDFEIFDAKNTAQLLDTFGHNILLPGMSINMAIILQLEFTEDDECPMPRCASKTFVDAIGGGRICSQCKVWFDGASEKRQGLELLLDRFKTLTKRNETEMLMLRHCGLQEASGLLSGQRISKIEHFHSEETSISAFKRIKYYNGYEVATDSGLHLLIDLKRRKLSYVDARRQEESPRSRGGPFVSPCQIPSEVFGLVQSVSLMFFHRDMCRLDSRPKLDELSAQQLSLDLPSQTRQAESTGVSHLPLADI